MDRKKKRGNYVSSANATLRAYGVRQETKKRKRRKPISAKLRIILMLAVTVLIILLAIGFSLQNMGRSEIGRITRIGATLSQNVSPFGDSVIFYDGTTLHCVAATGGNQWSYQIGTGADYDATDERVVAWSGNDLFILNKKGRLIYNNTMSDQIQFASAGDGYVAAFLGEPDNGVINVIDAEGQMIDHVVITDQTLLDIGFFYSTTSSSTKPTELMWVAVALSIRVL